jgi:cell division protein ZapA (FtsZ GTPase activity inhibitor)
MAEAKRSVSVRLRGQEFRVRTDDDEQALQRVAGFLDQTMETVARRTGTVDTLDVALLTGLNLAREIVKIREGRTGTGVSGLDPKRLRKLTDLAEAAVEADSL